MRSTSKEHPRRYLDFMFVWWAHPRHMIMVITGESDHTCCSMHYSSYLSNFIKCLCRYFMFHGLVFRAGRGHDCFVKQKRVFAVYVVNARRKLMTDWNRWFHLLMLLQIRSFSVEMLLFPYVVVFFVMKSVLFRVEICILNLF